MLPHDEILNARRTLSRLKRGVPPATDAQQLAVGMESLGTRLAALFQADANGRWFGVKGEYGEGKSFFQALSSQQALAAGYAVATLQVNKDEGALHQPQRHLSVVFQSLRSPLPEFQNREGIAEILRHWFGVTPKTLGIEILDAMQKVSPWIPAGRDPDLFADLIRRLKQEYAAVEAEPTVPLSGETVLSGLSNCPATGPEIVWDRYGNAYAKAPLTGRVNCRFRGSDNWEYCAPEEDWEIIRATFKNVPPQTAHSRSVRPPRRESCLPELLSFLSVRDLIARSSYARFAAAYRLQAILKWLEATGHQGLLLFIDEVDNVIRQIHCNALPACLRTLAWYCSCPHLANLRVVVAGTPELFEVVENQGREIADILQSQITVAPNEAQVFRKWKREADVQAGKGWEECRLLRPAQRVELFARIASLHRVAWGDATTLDSIDVDALARRPEFDTTRRWVRASVQLLDLLNQQQRPEPAPASATVPLPFAAKSPETATTCTEIAQVIDNEFAEVVGQHEQSLSVNPISAAAGESTTSPTTPPTAESLLLPPPQIRTHAFVPNDNAREVLRVVRSSTEPLGIWLLHVKTKFPILQLVNILAELVERGLLAQTGSGTAARYSRERISVGGDQVRDDSTA